MRTTQELQDALDTDLVWRRIEAQSLLNDARSSRGPQRDALTRAGVAMLYAHWEGYTKNSLTGYLRFVSRRRLTLKELAPGFAGMAVESELRRRTSLSEARHRTEQARLYLEGQDQRLSIPNKEVNTHGNLNSELCNELLDTLGLDRRPFATKSALIDYKLLRARNEVAHGRWSSITINALEELHHEVLKMMDTVRNLVMNAAENSEYRREPPSASP